MSGTPYIRFFGDDWLSGTNELSLEERGALITIVAIISTTGAPVNCDYDRLARRLGCTKNKARKIVNSLEEMGKIWVADGLIHNARALKEASFSEKKSRKNSENATRRWAKTEEKSNKNNVSDDATAMRPRMPKRYQPEPEPYIEKRDTSVSPKKKTAKRATALPENWVPSDKNIEDARKRKFTDEEINHEADRFKNYHIARGTTFKNWDAGWRTWLGNARKFGTGNRRRMAGSTTTAEIADFSARYAASRATNGGNNSDA